MPGHKILVIDDNVALLRLVEQILGQSGEQVFLASDGAEGLRQLGVCNPDLVILDIMMPKMDGWTVCTKIRQVSNVPIMIFTVLDEERNMVRGLRESTADDYLTKPFSANILIARVQALIRRAGSATTTPKPIIFDDGRLKINLAERQITVQGELVKLTMTEFRLLAYLAQNPNRVLSFDHILNHIWGAEYRDCVDYVHVYISRLRQKLEVDPKKPQYFLTHHSVGYRFQNLALPFECP